MRKFLSLSMASMAVAFSSYGQLSGVKTINPAGSGPDNYTSFTAAVNALKAAKTASGVAVNGTVTFNVTPGVYPERITIDSNTTKGASALNQIIFQKDPAAAAEEGVFLRPATAGTSVVNVYMAGWVTLDGINLEDGDDGSGTKYTNRGMQLSGAQHCTFKNFTIRMNARGQSINAVSRGIASGSTFGGATRTLSYNTFDNLRFVSISNRAFSLFSDLTGSDTNADLHDRGNVVTNCKIDSLGGGATGTTCLVAFFLEQDSLYFANNQITNLNHQPATASDMYAVQISSNPDHPDTRWVVVENNTIEGGADNVVSGSFNGMILVRTVGAVVKNNSISTVNTDDGAGLVSLANNDAEIANNTITGIASGSGDATGIITGSDDNGVKVHDNIISNLNTIGGEQSPAAIGVDMQSCIDSKVYNNKISNIFIGDGADATVAAVGARVSAAISDTSHIAGGNTYFYNNFVSSVYSYVADLNDEGNNLVYGVRSINFVDSDQLPTTGGTQHIYHNTVVLNRPTDLVGNIAHDVSGMVLFSSEDDETDAVYAKNNIIVNRNTYAEADTSFSVLARYVGNATTVGIEANNYFGYDENNVAMGVYYDAVADESTIYTSLAAWKAAGLDGAGNYSDSTEVSFADEANGDFHLSDADYVNSALRAPSLATVTVDFDGTARAAGNTAKGADAQAGEQDLLISVKNGLAKAKSLTVFPNPATEVARFQMTVEKETAAQIVVRNLMGQVVATKNVTLYAGANTTGINVSGLASGMYVYNVNVNGQSYAGKFVK